MIRQAILALASVCAAGAAVADIAVQATHYLCERSVDVPVVYINADGEQGVAVLLVEGGMFNLLAEPAPSGVRYGYPSDGSHYIWWAKGRGATLFWRDGATGVETPVYRACMRQS